MPDSYPVPAAGIQPVVDSIRARAAGARSLHQAGRFAQAAQQVAELIPEAAVTGYVPLQAELHYQLAQAHNGAAKAADAERALRETIRLGGLAKDDRLIARAYTLLLGVVGFQLARYDEALTLEGVAVDMIARAEGGEAMTADLAYYMGTAHFQKGKFDKAAASFKQSLDLRKRLFGPMHPDVAQAHNSLGGMLVKLGKIDEAERELERAVEIRTQVLGPVHPDVGLPLSNLGALANVRNDFAKAERYFGRAVTILEDMLGPDHPNVALTRVNLGNLARDRKDCTKAVAELTRAITSLEKMGANHPFLVNPLIARAHCRVDAGSPAEALPDADRAMAIAAEQKGDPAQLAQARFVRARALWDAGDVEQRNGNRVTARALAEEARAVLAAAGPVGATALAEVTAWQKDHP
jgi:serine/threonine-protein kinase